MKTNNLFNRIGLVLGLILIAHVAFAQPPHLCDTCNYSFHKGINPKVLDTLVFYTAQDTSEFEGCGSGTIKRKNITFIHGLGGSAASWFKQANWTKDNYITAKTLVNYPAKLQLSFDYIADEQIQDQIANGSSDVTEDYPGRCLKDDFVIAHSQGGIAARYLDWKWDTDNSGDFGTRKFYGLVTFATPHAGADIALTKDEHADFVQQAVSSVVLKDANEKIYDIAASVGYLFGVSSADLLNNLGDLIEEHLAPYMLAAVHAPTLEEMEPNSSTMNSLNNHKSRLRKTAFYGIEEAPECWKVMSNLTDTASEDYPIWGAINDFHLEEKMEEARAQHLTAITENEEEIKKLRAKQVGLNILFPFISLPITNKLYTDKYLELESQNRHRATAVRFMNNANTQWRYLIGSYHRDSTELSNQTVYVLKWKEKYGWLSLWYSQEREFESQDDANNFYDLVSVYDKKDKNVSTIVKMVRRQKFYPSDGVVLVKSQLAFPGVKRANTDKMEGDNHFQERNSPETLRVLQNLYDGEYDPYFTTDEK